jgi:hypothetical protein
MRLSRLLSLSLAAAGGLAAGRVLQRRHRWEQSHRHVAICVDFDDAYSASVRAGIPFDDLLPQLAHHGATHVSLPELTLNRLARTGRLAPGAPLHPVSEAPRAGHWNYLCGPEPLVSALAAELCARLPYTGARQLDGRTLAFAGELQTIGEIGLGFDATAAARMAVHGLGVVPRPVSYAWPEDTLIRLTLAQAAVFGRLIAFDGDMILGHEMHLDATLNAMQREGLTFVYFAGSRHQKGDWFVAKRRAPKVVIGHRFTAAEMVPLDFHAAAHQWAHLAREYGVRFCYVNFFRVLHATHPLEGLHYLEHIREALQGDGFVVTPDIALPVPVPAPTRDELALTGLASAGLASAGAASALNLPEKAALPLAALAAAGAAALPYLERPRGHLEEQYPPSYAPKLIALAASLAPAAARPDGPLAWAEGLAMQAAAGAVLAAATSGQDYQLRIEEYRGFNLHWAVPLAALALGLPSARLRTGMLAAVAAAWFVLTQRGVDPLLRFDAAHAEGHTHHLSAAARLAGDARIMLGLRPARKWSGLGAAGTALSLVLASRGHDGWAALAALAGAAGHSLGLVGWRRPERALSVTGREAIPSLAAGSAIGLLLLMLRKD